MFSQSQQGDERRRESDVDYAGILIGIFRFPEGDNWAWLEIEDETRAAKERKQCKRGIPITISMGWKEVIEFFITNTLLRIFCFANNNRI